jgi:hypothetical protein
MQLLSKLKPLSKQKATPQGKFIGKGSSTPPKKNKNEEFF